MARAHEFDDEADGDTGRTARTDAFWDEMAIDPVEIALPSGVGYTLRAYRMSSQVTPTDVSGRHDEIDMPAYRSPVDAEASEEVDLPGAYGEPVDADDEVDASRRGEDAEDAEVDEDRLVDEDAEEGAAGDDVALVDADESEVADEEVPVFLSHEGRLLLFKTAESLVEFVKSGADNDLAQLDEWERLRSGIRPDYVVALPDDQYELDLVVRNLRGGPEAWDAALIVQCGQVARDLGYALRIESVLAALSAGSPLDDLDEALRGVVAGGVGTFFARRRARKVGKETASLTWRTVIGKISSVVDWRD